MQGQIDSWFFLIDEWERKTLLYWTMQIYLKPIRESVNSPL